MRKPAVGSHPRVSSGKRAPSERPALDPRDTSAEAERRASPPAARPRGRAPSRFFRAGAPAARRSTAAPTRRLLHVALFVGVVLAALYAAYLAAANVILRTHLLRGWIDTSEDKTWVEYASAYSLWPGHVRVRDLLVRDRDPDVEWALSLKTARAHVGLIDLLGRRFHAAHLRARGVRFKLRSRPRPDAEQGLDPRFLPAIPGLEGPPPPRVEDDDTGPPSGDWRVRLDDVVASVAQVWLNTYRYDGRARATGGFALYPRNTLEVFPSTFELGGGMLSVKQAMMAQTLAGRLEGRIDECDMREDAKDRVLVCLSGKGHAEGQLGDARFLDVLLEPPPYVSLHGGEGRASADLELDHGRGSGRLQAEARAVEAKVGKRDMRGAIDGEIRMRLIDLGPLLADLTGTHIDVHDVVVRKAENAEPWWGKIRVTEGVLSTRQVTTVHTRLGIEARDARPLYSIVNAKLPDWVERALAMKNMDATMRFAFQKKRMDVDDLDASGGKVRIQGRFHRRGEKADGVFLVEDGPLAVGFDIDDQKSGLKLLFARHWYKKSLASGEAEADGVTKPTGRVENVPGGVEPRNEPAD